MSANKFILGTVQLGMSYGINNSTGQPDREKAIAILLAAYDYGVRKLDTAENYGDSQKIIGDYHRKYPEKKFQVCTKFQASNQTLSEQFDLSCYHLNVDSFHCYSFHSFKDTKNLNLMKAIVDLKKDNKIKKIGSSIYANDEFLDVISNPDIDVIQIPFNLLDNISKRGEIMKRAKDKGKEIHARSIFLQGLFYKDPDEYPAYLNDLKPYGRKLRELAADFHLNINEMSQGYVFGEELIDGVLCGVDTLEQLESNLSITDKKISKVLRHEINLINAPESLIDPRNWK